MKERQIEREKSRRQLKQRGKDRHQELEATADVIKFPRAFPDIRISSCDTFKSGCCKKNIYQMKFIC